MIFNGRFVTSSVDRLYTVAPGVDTVSGIKCKNIETFLKTVGFLQRYSDIKTPALCFDFETCSAHIYSKVKAFRKIYLWWSVLILWQAATNKSMYGKHCILLIEILMSFVFRCCVHSCAGLPS